MASTSVRWDNLFDDLEGQLEQELTAEEVDLRAEEERLRLGRMSLRDRLQALARQDERRVIRLTLLGGLGVAVRPATFGRDWFSADLVEESARHSQCIVPLAAIAELRLDRAQVSASLEGSEPSAPERGISTRLGFGFVLRDLCRRRSAVELRMQDATLHGTIDRVGRDHLDLAEHEPGTPRRESAVLHYRVLPLARLLLVRV
jgi:hypothetical protein